MTHLAMLFFDDPSVAVFSNFGLWAFLSVGAVALFGIFIPTVHWIDSRRKEREAFYKAETMRRITEASSDGARIAMDLMREQSRQTKFKRREGLKIGGLINIAVGVGLLIFLHALVHDAPVYLCGLIPGFIGVAMLSYALFLAPPIE
jgi:hypothetical protein